MSVELTYRYRCNECAKIADLSGEDVVIWTGGLHVFAPGARRGWLISTEGFAYCPSCHILGKDVVSDAKEKATVS